MRGGTQIFPDLGAHCEHEDCNQLDFLPFTCDGCQKVFCLEHRTYKSHGCTGSQHRSRTVVVCEICSAAVEKQGGGEDDVAVLERHVRPGEEAEAAVPRAAVQGGAHLLQHRHVQGCHVSVCLRHRFPSDHACARAARNGIQCGDRNARVQSPPSIKTY